MELSKNPDLLQGFNLNRRTPFETIIANRLGYTLSKETIKGSIHFPALIPGVNFFLPGPGKYSWYKFMVVLGIVEDMFYHEKGYQSEQGKELYISSLDETAWLPVTSHSPAFSMELHKLENYLDDISEIVALKRSSLLLGVGIAFGTMPRGQIEMVKYVGGAKVLAVV